MAYWGLNQDGSGFIPAAQLPAGTNVFWYANNNPAYADPNNHPQKNALLNSELTHWIPEVGNQILPLTPDGKQVINFTGKVENINGQIMYEVNDDGTISLVPTGMTQPLSDTYATGTGIGNITPDTATATIVGSANNTNGTVVNDSYVANQGASTMANENVFGEFSPQQQYTSMMANQMPNYYLPRYGQMAQRQFQPTFGSYLLGDTGAVTGQDFAPWYQAQGYQPGTAGAGQNITAGYNQALQFGAALPGSTAWNTLQTANPVLAQSMQDPEAVQAMALARYYGGGVPTGGYAQRAVSQSLGNLYDRYMTGGAEKGITSPLGFLGYLGGLNPTRWGAMPTEAVL